MTTMAAGFEALAWCLIVLHVSRHYKPSRVEHATQEDDLYHI